MTSLNKVTLIGNLGRDPDVRTMNNGGKVATLNIATSESWKDKNTGERQSKTEWHRVVIFDENIANVADQYLKKGSTVYIEGQLQTRKWTNDQGQDQYSTEVVLQKYRSTLKMLGGNQNNAQNNQNNSQYQQNNDIQSHLDDDIPF